MPIFLLTAEARRLGAEAKIARSPLAPQLAARQSERDALRAVLSVARNELGRLAHNHGFDLR